MKKYIIKIAVIIMISMITISNFALAFDFGDADEFIKNGSGTDTAKNISLDDIAKPFSDLGNILRFIGIGIVVIATTYMGILYMISPPEKQAKLKQQLIGLVVAAVVIIGGYYIWKLLTTALDSLTAG